MKTGGMQERYPLWDLPVRFIHWSLALCVPAAWWTAEEGYRTQHQWLGYIVITLVLTRVLWGFLGSPQARFSDFLRGPRALFRYWQSGASDTPGHNPLGGWSAMLLWMVLLVQAGTGLFNSDGILFTGPMYYAVDSDVADVLGEIHEVLFNILLGFIALHLAAIGWYQLRRGKKLLGPMWSGSTPGRQGTGPAAPTARALFFLALAAGTLWLVIASAPEPQLPW